MRILIYAGEGVSSFTLKETVRTFQEHFAHIDIIDAERLIEDTWEKETSLLIIPGGRDIPYDRKLKGRGTQKIRTFVENGGSFLGICAGAYFSSSEVVFEKGRPNEVYEKRDLHFFPGPAVGTLYPFAPFSYDSEEGAHPACIDYQGDQIFLYYNGGCAFHDADSHPEIEVLARYTDAAHQAAIIACPVGQGTAILSGVHFEVSSEGLGAEGSSQAIAKAIEKTDTKRCALVQALLERLNPLR